MVAHSSKVNEGIRSSKVSFNDYAQIEISEADKAALRDHGFIMESVGRTKQVYHRSWQALEMQRLLDEDGAYILNERTCNSQSHLQRAYDAVIFAFSRQRKLQIPDRGTDPRWVLS